MITSKHRCSECGNEMIIDHISETDNITQFYYTCVNPKCTEFRKAYTPMGDESEAQVKPKTE